MTQAVDRHLLFGLLALQTGLIQPAQLVAAFHAWTTDKGRPLADHLVALGHLAASQRPVIEALAAIHLDAHGGDAEKSLAAIPAAASTRRSLAAVGDPEVEATITRIGSRSTEVDNDPDPDADPDADDRTSPYAASSPASTADGRRFRILRPHARGGLGAVFVAMDGELHREVALKQILEKHADDPSSRARFVLEAEITGALEHPGIVPVYSLGAHENGRPYYAMRFIKGESLKEAADRFHADADPGRRSLGRRQLLRRFIDVCDAIGYAHSRGILHRDIKPANVIVGKHGETLVVDWGLAKAMGHSEPGSRTGERTLIPSNASGTAETIHGSAMGTPAYMSPEQSEGDLERLGPRSDVYSLGATLYYVLTGRPPFAGGAAEVLRRVQRGEFPPPRRHDPAIDRALEAICLRAMALDPSARYATPGELAADIERWMDDEPVSAWREPLSRRARRWASRNRTAVGMAAVAGLCLLVGLSAVAVVQTQAKAEIAQALRRETRTNAALAAANEQLARSRAAVQARYELAVDAVKTFHTGVSEDFLLREPKFKELRDRLLRSASDFYGKLGALLGKETDLASRRALALANYELAGLTAKVGRAGDAMSAYRAVLASQRALASEAGSDAAAAASATIDAGRSLTAIAMLLESSGKTGEAMDAYREAEGLLAVPSARSDEARAALASCRSRMGWLLSTIGRPAEALEAYRRARANQEAMAAASVATEKVRRDLADTVNRMAILMAQTGRTKEAEAEYRDALSIQRALVDADPAAELRLRLAGIHNNLGALLSQTGRPREAEAEYRDALGLYRALTEASPAVTEFRSRLALAHGNLGALLRQTGRIPEAEPEYRRALAIHRELADEDPTVTGHRALLADSHDSLGRLLFQTGRTDAAEAEYRDALEIRRRLVEESPAVTAFRVRLADTHYSLGRLLLQAGRPGESEAAFRAALEVYRVLAGARPTAAEYRGRMADVHNSLGAILSEAGRPEEAAAEFRSSLSIYGELAAANPTVVAYRGRLAVGRHNLAVQLAAAGRLEDAEAEYRAALSVFGELAAANPTVAEYRGDLADGHAELGRLLARTGRMSEAESERRAALAILRELAESHPAVPEYRRGLAAGYADWADLVRSLGRFAEARGGYDQAVALLEVMVREAPVAPVDRGRLARGLRRRGLARHALGDPSGAEGDARAALAILDALTSRNADDWFETACCHAATSGIDRALEALGRAVALGFRDRDALRGEPALAPLCGRPDFRLFLMDLAFPDRPFAGDGP